MDAPIGIVRISTEAIAEKDRVEVAREIFGRQMLRLELEEAGNAPFRANLKLQAFPGIRIVTGAFSAARITRTRTLLSDGNDDLFLTLNQDGPFEVAQRGTDFMLGDGEAVFSSCGDLIRFERPAGRAIGLRIPRNVFASQIPNVDDKVNQLIPRNDRIMTLLRGYLTVFEEDANISSAFAKIAATHIHDLVALSLGAQRDYVDVARGRGLRAARLHAIKASIVKNLVRHDLSVNSIAAMHRLTARHVQRLFEPEGTTFSQFVLRHRLARAHAMLIDSSQISKSIGQIIFNSGFGDVSHFNHAFRQRYGCSPSEIRNQSVR